MELMTSEVLDILRKKKIKFLYHANSVFTSCHFLKLGGLCSRGYLERAHHKQTIQKSDDGDKSLGIWHDLFLDSRDIHDWTDCKNISFYGPVMFKLDVEILEQSETLWVTKRNPIYWRETTSETKRWFQNTEELERDYDEGNLGQHIVLRSSGGYLSFSEHLISLTIDDPLWNSTNGFDYASMAYGALKHAATIGEIGAKIVARDCPKKSCVDLYEKSSERFNPLFLPGFRFGSKKLL